MLAMVIDERPDDRDRQRPWWFFAALAGVALGGVVWLLLPESFLRQEDSAASSCEQRNWPAITVSCRAARNTSVTAPIGVPGAWTVRIWLTTLEAVDARLHPPRQVADHPTGNAAVWLFIYENPGTGDRVLHVAAATNARPGAYIYIYHWPELGSPAVPETMPAIYTAVGARD
jgi:hypothetical protein